MILFRSVANAHMPKSAAYLPHAVSAVNLDIRTSRVAARITRKVHIRALQLLRVTVPPHGGHALPQVLGLLVDEVRQPRVDVAGGDAVDAGEVAPLVGEGAGEVDAAGLGDVVGGLLLREVDDVAGHGGGDDEGAAAALLEVLADGLGAVRRAVEVDVDHLVPGLLGALEEAAVSGGASAVFRTLVSNNDFSIPGDPSSGRREKKKEKEGHAGVGVG